MISEQLRKAIETSGKSRYRISQESGIEQATLHRFVHGERGLSQESIDQLAEYFGFVLVRKGK